MSAQSTATHSPVYRVWGIINEFSLLLISGAVLALIWANLDYEAYHGFVEYELLKDSWVGHLHDGHRVLTIHYLVNDVLMAFFFAIAGKEVWEAVILRNGSLRGRKALTPLVATAGGMVGPVAIYFLVAVILGKTAALANGWAVPTATDIAFSYLVGRIVFGAGHPAVAFLLLLAIADDAAGLVIIAIAYPSGELKLEWLLMSVAAAIVGYLLLNWLPRHLDKTRDDQVKARYTRALAKGDFSELQAADKSYETWVRVKLGFWPWAVVAAISWFGFQEAGVHPALGLLPIIPAIPHADISFGFFAEKEKYLDDTLNHIEHSLKVPVEVILFFFGLANAGVQLSSVNEATYAVLAGLFIGKPLGIWLFGVVAANGLKLGLPQGMRSIDLFVIGCIAAIGFTVSLFVAVAAFGDATGDAKQWLEGAKMGALLSFFAAGMAIAAGWLCKVERMVER